MILILIGQNKNRDIKLIPEMLNLLGCSREVSKTVKIYGLQNI